MNLSASHIGSIASRLIAQEPDGEVMGISSRGVYLGTATNWVLFLTSENNRGPLTLNMQDIDGGLARLVVGSPAQVSPRRIDFPSANLTISTAEASIWEATPPSKAATPTIQRQVRLEEIRKHLLSNGKSSTTGMPLPLLASFKGEPGTHTNKVYPLVERLREAVYKRQVGGTTEAIDALLGMGTGLTPSGDDLTLGFILTLNRWGQVLANGLDVTALNREITGRAYRKTTTLSANLIECASQGQASEPLLLALDGMMTGKPDAAACAGLLAGWGNTSGIDAFVGMALAMG